MIRHISAAELDRMEALAAVKQPPKPPAPSAEAKMIANLQAKLAKQRNQIGRLEHEAETLRSEKALLLLDLNNERAAHDRLRKLARGEG